MGRKGSIDTLPPDILEQLQALLRDPRMTQLDITAEINALLDGRGEEPVSKSAVNRYKVKMDSVGADMRQSREMAAMWIGKLGAAPQGQIGHLTNEIIRTLAFDLSVAMKDLTRGELEPEAMMGVVKMVRDLSFAVEKLEKAASENVKRDADIKRQVAEELAAKAGAEGGGAVTPERLREIVRESYGISL